MDASNLEEVACYGKAATELQSFVSHEMNVLKRQAATARDATKKHARKISRVIIDAWTCCHFSALPTWMQDNDYLLASHRPQLNCFKACALSIFRLHSETGNIWTHLLGALLFAGLAVYLYVLSPTAESLRIEDKLMFGFYFLTAVVCLAFSTIFHTFSCHSRSVGKICGKLDYCGISLLCTGSFVPWIYYAFYCSPSAKLVYLILVPLFGASVIFISLCEKFASPAFRPMRAAVFVTFGVSIAVPFSHWFFSATHITISLTNVALVGLFYIGGAVLYAARIPERFFPGKCDYLFQSHQIFHVCVVAAALIHYLNIQDIASLSLSDHGNPYEAGVCASGLAPLPTVAAASISPQLVIGS